MFVVVSGTVLVYYQEKNMMRMEKIITTNFVRARVNELLLPGDFSYPVPSSKRFMELFQEIQKIPNIVAVMAYDTDSTIIWSDIDGLSGRRTLQDLELKKALRGEGVIMLGRPRKAEGLLLKGYRDFLRIYVPVFEGDNVTGVIVVYRRATDFFNNIRKGKLSIWVMAVGGGVLFYISYFGIFYRSYSHQKKIDEGIRELNKELSALNSIAITVSQSLEIDQLLNKTLENILEILGIKIGWIVLMDRDKRELFYATSVGISKRRVEEKVQRFKSGEWREWLYSKEMLGVVKKPLICQEEIGCCVYIPIVSTSSTLGLIGLTYPADQYNVPVEKNNLLVSIGHQIGVAVEKALLYRDLREFNKDLERMVEERTVALRRSRDEIKAVFDAVTDVIVVIDPEYNVIMSNKAAREVFQDFGEIESRKCYELFRGTDSPCPDCLARKTLQSKRSAMGEIENTQNGEIFSLSVFPVLDDSGGVRAFIEYAKVITEQKKMEEQMIQMEKLSSLGELISEIAHQINNPLVGVVNYAQLGLKQLKEGISPKEELAIIEEAGKECKAIIKKLLDFTKPATFELKVVDCNELIEESLNLFEKQIELGGMNIRKEFGEGIPPVRVDPTLMKQVFFNLIMNAKEAIDGDGGITVRTRSLGKYVEINFIDTGPGIDKEHLPHIFSPFFTTKREKGGTGLGLSVVSNIIVRHEGKIWVASEVGKGTTFTIRLPVVYNA